jgi:hypothetical protein
MRRLFILLIPVLIASCSSDKSSLLVKKWNAFKVDNPDQDSFLKDQELFIDTFGKNNDAATNIAMYGFSNVDSARASLKAQYTDYQKMQQHAVENTWFDFRKDSVVVMNFSGQQDSAKWYFNKEGKLMLDEKKLKGQGNTLTMEVIALTDTALTLKFTDGNGTSTVSFHPAKK